VTPYYEHGGITIYHGDCRELLTEIRADVVVTDPPFGIADKPITFVDRPDGRRGPRGGHVNTWHPASEWDKELDPSWLPIALMLVPAVAMFGQWRKRSAFEAAAGMEPRAEIVWAKNMHTGAPCPVAPRDERIWVFSHASLKPRRFETSVWDEAVIPTWEYKAHKNEKPLRLMSRLITWLPDGIVLDPYMGSGTTLAAAKGAGQRAVGIDIEERYCEIAAKRLQQEVLPLEQPA
jgi:DNA modification methylase